MLENLRNVKKPLIADNFLASTPEEYLKEAECQVKNIETDEDILCFHLGEDQGHAVEKEGGCKNEHEENIF